MNSIKRTFWTAAGLLGLAAILALPAAADQQILDDLIVDGSACVGFDCVNGESFGFDTVRLKENNVRLHFSDTSTSASFPSNDWRIVANDTSNGGGNYLGFEDSTAGRMPFRVEAGAPSHSLYVEDGGRIGFGTSTPVVELHVRDGDSPTLRLEQDGSSGFTPQTWDVAGNEANFFVRDVTNGSKLSFKIKPGAPNNSMYIAADGSIGLSTAVPAQELHILRSDADGTRARIENNNAAAQVSALQLANVTDVWVISNQTNDDQMAISLNGSGGQEVTVRARGGVGAAATLQVDGEVIADNVATASSRALKTAFEPVDRRQILETLVALPVTAWRFKQDDPRPHLGPVAEDFQAAFGLGDGKSITLSDANGVVMAAIQGLYQVVREKDQEIAQLEARLEALEGAQSP